MFEYFRKNSTHPFRIFDSNAWLATRQGKDKTTAHISLVIYNAYLAVLGLCLIGYSGYLINRDNTAFAKILMIVGSYMVATSLFFFAFPYAFSSKINSGIWFGLNSLLFIFTLACCVLSFMPKLAEEVIKLDVGHNNKRPNAGIFFVHNQELMNAVTILGCIFTLCGMGAFGYLWSTWKDYIGNAIHNRKANPAGFSTHPHNVDLNNVEPNFPRNNVINTNHLDPNNNRRVHNAPVPVHGDIEIEPQFRY